MASESWVNVCFFLLISTKEGQTHQIQCLFFRESCYIQTEVCVCVKWGCSKLILNQYKDEWVYIHFIELYITYIHTYCHGENCSLIFHSCLWPWHLLHSSLLHTIIEFGYLYFLIHLKFLIWLIDIYIYIYTDIEQIYKGTIVNHTKSHSNNSIQCRTNMQF